MRRHVIPWLLTALVLPLAAPAPAAASPPVEVQAPATPAAVPLILAAARLPEVRLGIFTSHAQAHARFLKGRLPVLATGLAAGVRFFRQGAPVAMTSAYVSGMTYVVADFPAEGFQGLRGRPLWLPFPGSPIEEVTRFFMSREGLRWRTDIPVGYAGFPAVVEMLRRGRIHAAVLPEPFVSLVLQDPQFRVVLSYRDLWQRHTGRPDGYPQVGIFVAKAWAVEHGDLIRRLNTEIGRAIREIRRAPEDAAPRAAALLPFDPDVLSAALRRTDFHLLEGPSLQQAVTDYQQRIGDPIDATFDAFF